MYTSLNHNPWDRAPPSAPAPGSRADFPLSVYHSEIDLALGCAVFAPLAAARTVGNDRRNSGIPQVDSTGPQSL